MKHVEPRDMWVRKSVAAGPSDEIPMMVKVVGVLAHSRGASVRTGGFAPWIVACDRFAAPPSAGLGPVGARMPSEV